MIIILLIYMFFNTVEYKTLTFEINVYIVQVKSNRQKRKGDYNIYEETS